MLALHVAATALHAQPTLHASRRAPLCVTMGAPEWLAVSRSGMEAPLPLLVAPLRNVLLPGDATHMRIEEADEVAAVEQAYHSHGCVGLLLRTPGDTALCASPLLEIRHVRKLEVGVLIDVVAVGRVDVKQVRTSSGFIEGVCVENMRDSAQKGIVMHSTDEKLLTTVAQASELVRSLRAKLAAHDRAKDDDKDAALPMPRGVVVPTSSAAAAAWSRQPLPSLDATTRQKRDELLAIDLDRPPVEDLSRYIALWGAESEEAAAEQVLSFAACAPLPAIKRAQALGITNTAERLQHAHRSLERMAKLCAARLAVREALA